jgi:hypothetical protein
MTDIWDEFTPPPKVRRDRYQRYLVLPPGATKPVGYTRATTVAKAIEDASSLINWKGRMVALGLAARPDLYAGIHTTNPDDKRALDALCERAAEAGGATIRRDLGTALHHMLEQSWRDPAYMPPATYAGDVTAVHQALADAGFTVVAGMTERMVVNDDRQIAGTFDLLVTDGTTTYVADIKTGSSVIYGGLAFATQLAIYAGAADLYTQGAAADGSEDTREPMPEVSGERAVIIHVQPESGHCELHWLDLTVGAAALDLAISVREIRKAKPLLAIDPTVTGAPAVPAPGPADPFAGLPDATGQAQKPRPVERREWLRARIANILGAEVRSGLLAEMNVDSAGVLMVQWWPEGVPTLRESEAHTDAQLDAIAERCTMVEKALELTFPDPDPSVPLVPERLAADDVDVVRMVLRLKALPSDLLAAVEANAARIPNMVALTSGRVTPELLDALDELVVNAETAHQGRLAAAAALCSSLSALGVPEATVVEAATNGAHRDPARLTEAQLDRFWALVDALEIGLVVQSSTEGLIAGGEAPLVAIHGNKRDALNAAKRHAKAHELTVPKSFADVLANPMLVALAGRRAPAEVAT